MLNEIEKIDKKIGKLDKKIKRKAHPFLYEIFENHYDNKKKRLSDEKDQLIIQKTILEDERRNEDLNARSR